MYIALKTSWFNCLGPGQPCNCHSPSALLFCRQPHEHRITAAAVVGFAQNSARCPTPHNFDGIVYLSLKISDDDPQRRSNWNLASPRSPRMDPTDGSGKKKPNLVRHFLPLLPSDASCQSRLWTLRSLRTLWRWRSSGIGSQTAKLWLFCTFTHHRIASLPHGIQLTLNQRHPAFHQALQTWEIPPHTNQLLSQTGNFLVQCCNLVTKCSNLTTHENQRSLYSSLGRLTSADWALVEAVQWMTAHFAVTKDSTAP